jgi:hypothetical protein
MILLQNQWNTNLEDYKQDIFGNKSDDEIKAFIYKHLDDASSNSKDFAFGKYLSFIK